MVPVPTIEPLTAENVLWSNTVLAAGSAVGFVIYTGLETRAVMNTSHPETKVGLLDIEINRLAKVRLILTSRLQFLNGLSDFMHSHFRVILCPGSVERFPRVVVHLYIPVFNPVFVHYTHQVCANHSLWVCSYTYMYIVYALIWIWARQCMRNKS